MRTQLRVAVLCEGKDERGKNRTLPPFAPVPHEQQGAMEILVRRALYPLLNDGQPWHRGLVHGDGIQILQPPAVRLPRQPSMVEVLADPNALALVISAALKPLRPGPAPVDLLVATHDADGAAPALKALAVVNSSLGTNVPLLQPVPEIQAWLARKRAIELVYEREHCSVPEPDEETLKRGAKTELLRLLRTFGGKFDARMQARLAEYVSAEDLSRYAWAGWERATQELETALAARAVSDR